MTLPQSLRFVLSLIVALVVPVAIIGQSEDGLDPVTLLQPLQNSWPTYSGDYTGRRYSALEQVTTENVQRLTLAWTRQMNTGMPSLNGPNSPTFVGGEGTGDFTIGGQRIKGSILQVGDLLYVTAPSGPSMRATVANGGTIFGKHGAARTSATVVRPSGGTRCSSKQ